MEVTGVLSIGLEAFLFGDGFLFWGADIGDAVAGLDVSGAEGLLLDGAVLGGGEGEARGEMMALAGCATGGPSLPFGVHPNGTAC